MFTTQAEWNTGYAAGHRYRRLGDHERSLLATHVPAPVDGRALDIGCGVGDLAAHLSSLGHRVDAVDWSDNALAEAAAQHGKAARWLRLDIEGDDWTPLHADGYDVITLRFVYPFLKHRDRTMQALGRRLRAGGAVVVIAPLAADTPAERRGIALDENELARLQAGWSAVERHDTEGLAFVVLRGPHPVEATPSSESSADRTRHALTDRQGAPPPLRQHHFDLRERYYAQVESGRKTIEVRVRTPTKAAVEAGDTIVFREPGSGRELDVVAQRITPYTSFDELLDAEDPGRIDPDSTREEQLTNLRRIYPPEREALGPLAFEFDHRPGRPGRPLPMAPAEYVQTVPHHTVYACLYLRDEHDRPVQLRSVYGNRPWQFPGGNADAAEDPLQTARREAREETGLELGRGEPRLLLTHYLCPGPGRPLGKVGFVFDGGRLGSEQLRRIRLDPAEHDLWAVHDLTDWHRLMGEVLFARLDAIERARRGEGPNYLVTGP
ncbi:methyltransferase [Streptomyces sp. NPDC001852]|uniref:methyltransferase n=1 Tax=Streptomyces sp. NPDC001852 TaxID=3364619 RepID=UPI0036B8EB5A